MLPFMKEYFDKIKNVFNKQNNDLKILYLERFETPKNIPLQNQTTATLGELKLNNKRICYTLEPPWRNNGKDSCIPTGEYLCTRYSSKKHPNSWIINDIPNRSYVLIHTGNTEVDSLACVIVGMKIGYLNHKRAVLDSRSAYKKLQKILKNDKKFKLIIAEIS